MSTHLAFGLHGINRGSCSFPEVALRVAQSAEAAGFDSLWAAEHVILPDPQPAWFHTEPTFRMCDPLITLAFLASGTRTIKLATGVMILPQRNPLIVAKELATLDVLSAGRLLVGIGVGYVEREFQALQVPFQERGRRMDEYIAALRILWTQEQPLYQGQFITFSGIQSHPRPIQKPHPPLIIGGQAPAAYRRTLQHARGWYGYDLTLADITRVMQSLQQAAEKWVRPPELGKVEINAHLSIPVTPQIAEQLFAMGVHRIILELPRDGSLDDIERLIAYAHKELIYCF